MTTLFNQTRSHTSYLDSYGSSFIMEGWMFNVPFQGGGIKSPDHTSYTKEGKTIHTSLTAYSPMLSLKLLTLNLVETWLRR
jgi:hypothetical protein